jgi:diguanylate cyclase (GGDEF)-like protein
MTSDPRDAPLPHRGTVLVVDDAKVVRAVVASYLRGVGYHVAEAENGAQALRLMEDGAFDAVLTDLHMPDLDGFGLLEAVKKRSLGSEVIILTGTHAQDMSAALKALRLGAHDFLTKPPAGPDEVTLTVDRAVEKKRLRDANLRLMRELESLSRIDALTGVMNRRVFDEALRREAARAERYGHPLSLALFDLDNFKNINDTYGHPAGDGVLRIFARRAEKAFREADAIHRYGGEEFAVLLPHATLEGAAAATRRLVKATAAAPFELGSLRIDVTVSAGIACKEGARVDPAALLAAADAAVYEAKRTGRNRACVAQPGA